MTADPVTQLRGAEPDPMNHADPVNRPLLTDEPAPPDTGRTVAGRYRLLAPLGTGSTGTVWRARDELIGRPVAVKQIVFPPTLSEAERDVQRERTRREARAAARLAHPSAVTVYDVVEEAGSPYLVLELVEGRSLSQVVRSDGPLSTQRAAQVGLALLGALETAHNHGIVHRDVKPGNVLLAPAVADAPGRVVLTDFGIASRAGDPSITSTGMLLGSPAYIAPERARGANPGPASDLWSLGATLFTAVEGRPPYDEATPVLTVTAVVTGEHVPMRLAGALAPVIEGLLQRDPTQRLNAATARALLTPIAATISATSAAPEAERPPLADIDRERHAETATSALPLAVLHVAFDRVEPELTPAPRRASRRRRRAPLVLLMLAVIAAASAAVYALAGQPALPVLRQAAPASPATRTGASPAAAAATTPVGWTRYADPAGWSIAVPPDYIRSTYKGQVQLRDNSLRRTLRIDVVTGDGDALASSQSYGAILARGFADQGYRPLAGGPATFRGFDAADTAFRWREGVDLQVLDRTVVPPGGPTYRLYWQTNTVDWDNARPLLDQLLATFTPGR